MQNDISAWISKCPQCQLARSSDKIKHHAPMKPLDVDGCNFAAVGL